MQRERAELEQNFAREIGNLVHKLSAEKDQLEAELKLKMDQEVMVVRWVMTSQRVSVQGGESCSRDVYSYMCRPTCMCVNPHVKCKADKKHGCLSSAGLTEGTLCPDCSCDVTCYVWSVTQLHTQLHTHNTC